jgi:hypothetical protein
MVPAKESSARQRQGDRRVGYPIQLQDTPLAEMLAMPMK